MGLQVEEVQQQLDAASEQMQQLEVPTGNPNTGYTVSYMQPPPMVRAVSAPAFMVQRSDGEERASDSSMGGDGTLPASWAAVGQG